MSVCVFYVEHFNQCVLFVSWSLSFRLSLQCDSAFRVKSLLYEDITLSWRKENPWHSSLVRYKKQPELVGKTSAQECKGLWVQMPLDLPGILCTKLHQFSGKKKKSIASIKNGLVWSWSLMIVKKAHVMYDIGLFIMFIKETLSHHLNRTLSIQNPYSLWVRCFCYCTLGNLFLVLVHQTIVNSVFGNPQSTFYDRII